MRISDWSSDVCSSDLRGTVGRLAGLGRRGRTGRGRLRGGRLLERRRRSDVAPDGRPGRVWTGDHCRRRHGVGSDRRRPVPPVRRRWDDLDALPAARIVTAMTAIALLEFDPIVTLELGPLQISPHGIFTAIGFIAGARLLLPATRRHGVDDEIVYTMLYRAAIGALIGARLAYALNHWADYADRPLEVLAVWEGGSSLFGGIFGGVLAAVPGLRQLGTAPCR